MLWRPPRLSLAPKFITFSSATNFTVSVYQANWNNTVEYSTDGETWTEWFGEEVSSVAGKVMFRGVGNTYFKSRFVLNGSAIHCDGNVEALIDHETVEAGQHPVLGDHAFSQMFGSCSALVSAPSIPCPTMTAYCCSGMFSGCTSLVTPPGLPSIDLDLSCYSMMFSGCTALETAPDLPATTIYKLCYHAMFEGCTSLIKPPKISATVVTEQSCEAMFYNCTSLNTLPELPALTLQPRCYGAMFYNCSSIKLSTTQDSTYQYPYRIPTTGIGTDTSGTGRPSMFQGTGGTFTGTPQLNTTYYTNHEPVS